MSYKSPVSGTALVEVEKEIDGKKVTVYRDTATGQDFTKEYLKEAGIKDVERGEEAGDKKPAKKKATETGPTGPAQ